MTSPISQKRRGVLSRLYHGETEFNIVGRWKIWFVVSGVLIAIGLGALFANGLNLGIDFTGGTVWEVPAGKGNVADVDAAVRGLGYDDVQVQEVTQASGGDSARMLRVEAEATASPSGATTRALDGAGKDLRRIAKGLKGTSRSSVLSVEGSLDGIDGPFATDVPDELKALQGQIDDLQKALDGAKGSRTKIVSSSVADMRKNVDALASAEQAERERVGQAVSKELARQTGSKISEVTVDTVGPSWGQQISQKARTALIVFLIAIAIYITLRFEFRMAVATLAALIHDLLVVVGLYAVFQFPVTPATVIAVLTILGFSIYDGIVVFDRVAENSHLLGRKSKMNYTEMANLSMNQVLMRSLNTSITALLPILSVLLLGAVVLGATALEDFGLALFLGLLSGAYSSIFIATPLLALLKEREPRYRELRERLAGQGREVGSGSEAPGDDVDAASADGVTTVGVGPGGEVVPRPRKQGKKR